MIVFGFFLSVLFLSLQTLIPLFYSFPVLAFIPFLALVNLTYPLYKVLFWSCFAGIIIDLLSYDPFGIHALNYTLTSFFCFRGRRYFSLEAPLQFSLYTAFFSLISTILQILLLFLFDRRILFQGKWWLIDGPLLPMFDALYALIWFVGPLHFVRILRRLGGIYWLKKHNISQN